MDSQQHNSNCQVEAVDDDEVRPQYRVERDTSKLGRKPGRGGNSLPAPPAPSRRMTRSTQSPHSSPGDEGLWILRTFKNLVSPASKRSPSNTKDERNQKENVKTLLGMQETQESNSSVDQAELSQHQMIELEHEFQDILKNKDREWVAREEELQRQIHQAQQHMVEMEQIFQAKLHDIQLEKFALEAQHNAFIRKQQEASFKQMESALWLPVDETKVMSDLDKLKRDMRSWAKATSIKDISMLHSLGEEENAALMQQLSNVVVLENHQLPESIFTTAKSPMLLLNALLTDHVYMSFFRSPFFSLRGDPEVSSSNRRPKEILENIYQWAKRANPEDAHIWRSQTLRLLMPPMRNDMSNGEKELRHRTEEVIARVAQEQAMAFMSGPASFLVENNTKSNVVQKLNKIYDEAARQSYMLWTRRTEMRCLTLRDIEQPLFDAEHPYFDPDTLMRHEDHDDQLKNKPVTVLVHPLLEVAGTDEAKNYDQERIWVKGVVWLDSKMA